jgi:antitoxin component of MazEF toxin-antitoxin module
MEAKESGMPQLTIISHGEVAALILPPAVLESAGFHVGDTIDVTLGDGQLILRSADDASRRQRLKEISDDVLDKRRDAYERLA